MARCHPDPPRHAIGALTVRLPAAPFPLSRTRARPVGCTRGGRVPTVLRQRRSSGRAAVDGKAPNSGGLPRAR